jgi:hypothetical protein
MLECCDDFDASLSLAYRSLAIMIAAVPPRGFDRLLDGTSR